MIKSSRDNEFQTNISQHFLDDVEFTISQCILNILNDFIDITNIINYEYYD